MRTVGWQFVVERDGDLAGIPLKQGQTLVARPGTDEGLTLEVTVTFSRRLPPNYGALLIAMEDGIISHVGGLPVSEIPASALAPSSPSPWPESPYARRRRRQQLDRSHLRVIR